LNIAEGLCENQDDRAGRKRGQLNERLTQSGIEKEKYKREREREEQNGGGMPSSAISKLEGFWVGSL
jgi:hypothetical protein